MEVARRLSPAVLAIVLATVTLLLARVPEADSATRADIASDYRFTRMPIAMPPGYRATQTIREVNPAYHRIRSWISAVGASIALTDLRGHGRSDGVCLVDTRSDQVVVSHTPTASAPDRFTPFVLDPAPLPYDSMMAPMGCTPADLNQDGRMDLLVNYWGRTPVVFLARAGQDGPSAAAYRPVELVPTASFDGNYHGQRWNTNALCVADFDADGHPDVMVTNYFPDSGVLDPTGQDDVVMNSSMSNALNGGGTHLMRWFDAKSGAEPDVRYVEERDAVPQKIATGWTLAVSAADLTGDGRPEVYVANDFGKDRLLNNRSTPGRIRFTEAIGERKPATPKSFVLGYSSFKGMGVDFTDLDRNGSFDMLVTNITAAWGLEESNFVWMNDTQDEAQMRTQLNSGFAPFTQRARELGLAWTGWGWDVKAADFRNSGSPDVLQAQGFIKGSVDRWPWLQEMAMNNDNVYTNPRMWPDFQPGDDIAGDNLFAFYAKDRNGRYVNINRELGMTVPIPSRGIAVADTRGEGLLDFAVARQMGAPEFYANSAPDPGAQLTLRLYRPVPGGAGADGLSAPGTPAYGATVQVRTASGRTTIERLDGGGGHSGKRGHEIHIGLGDEAGPAEAILRWTDLNGQPRRQELRLAPGEHSYLLAGGAEEVGAR